MKHSCACARRQWDINNWGGKMKLEPYSRITRQLVSFAGAVTRAPWGKRHYNILRGLMLALTVKICSKKPQTLSHFCFINVGIQHVLLKKIELRVTTQLNIFLFVIVRYRHRTCGHTIQYTQVYCCSRIKEKKARAPTAKIMIFRQWGSGNITHFSVTDITSCPD